MQEDHVEYKSTKRGEENSSNGKSKGCARHVWETGDPRRSRDQM